MRIVIIGGEAAGMSAAAKARRLARDAEIVVYEASEVISFGACGLPYFVGDDFQEPGYMAEFTPEQFAAKGIEVKIGHRVLIGDALCVAAGWLRLHWLPCCLFMAIGKFVRYWLVAQTALAG